MFGLILLVEHTLQDFIYRQHTRVKRTKYGINMREGLCFGYTYVTPTAKVVKGIEGTVWEQRFRLVLILSQSSLKKICPLSSYSFKKFELWRGGKSKQESKDALLYQVLSVEWPPLRLYSQYVNIITSWKCYFSYLVFFTSFWQWCSKLNRLNRKLQNQTQSNWNY